MHENGVEIILWPLDQHTHMCIHNAVHVHPGPKDWAAIAFFWSAWERVSVIGRRCRGQRQKTYLGPWRIPREKWYDGGYQIRNCVDSSLAASKSQQGGNGDE